MKTEIKIELDTCTSNDDKHEHITEIKLEPGICTSNKDEHKHETEVKVEPGTCISNDDKHKQVLTDAMHYAVNQLKEEGLMTSTVSKVISNESEKLGREICRRVKDLTHDQEVQLIEVKEELVTESDLEERAGASFSSDGNFTSEDVAMSHDAAVPWDMKVKAVTLAMLYPKWSLKAIREKTTHHLRTPGQLWTWKQAVRNSSVSENYNIIGELTYQRFLDACSKSQPVTARTLQNWGIEASQQFLSTSFKFKASPSWIFKLMKKYNIRECKKTGFLKM